MYKRQIRCKSSFYSKEKTGISLVRAESLVDVPTDDMWKMLKEAKLRSSWEQMIQAFTILEVLNEHQDVVHYSIKVY